MQFSTFADSGHNKLIKRYVHSGNTVVQPTAIDMTTGIITTSTPHGLVSGNEILLAFNADINPNYCPSEWFANIDYLQVSSVPSPTQIILAKTSAPSTLFTTYATKATVDMTKIHFETIPMTITISGFKTKKLRVRQIYDTGRGDCYQCVLDLQNNSWQGNNFAYFSGGLCASSNATHALYKHIISDVVYQIAEDGRCTFFIDSRQWSINGSSPTFQEHSPGTGYASSLKPISGGYMTSININNSNSTSITSGCFQPWLNGSICELYDLS